MKRAAIRRSTDQMARYGTSVVSVATSLLVVVIGLVLLVRSWPIFVTRPLGELLFSPTWKPLQNAFGYYPFIMGTLWVTGVAMVIAIPICLLTSIYLAEYASRRVYAIVKPLIDVSAGIPSVIFGIWGVIIVVPLVQQLASSNIGRSLSRLPFLEMHNPTGYSVLAGGIVLAVMVFPVIISVAEEVIRAVPIGLREASWALGATRWQTTKYVVLRHAAPGVLAAIVLGFSRAFGETMAVIMVVGNVPQVPRSLFDAAYPLTALIANSYGEMMSIPLYDAALLGAALLLLVIVLLFNLSARLVLMWMIRYR
ncbi:MAG: phosphate ABC transporter permease subunit PstC [Anaerolineae bacterium]